MLKNLKPKVKHLRSILSLILCFTLLSTSVVVNLIVNAENEINYIVWEADADTVFADENRTVNANVTGTTITTDVVKGNENGIGYYKCQYTNVQGNGNDTLAVARTSVNSNTASSGWLSNLKYLNNCTQFFTLKFDYRIIGENSLPADARLKIYAANKNNPKIALLADEAVVSSNEWKSYSAKSVNSFSSAWSDGLFAYEVVSASSAISGDFTVEIKGLSLLLSDSDRNAFNTEMAKNTTDLNAFKKITNFTKNVSAPKPYMNKYNFMYLMQNYDSCTRLSQNKSSDAYDVTIKHSDIYDIAVSRTRAISTQDGTTKQDVNVQTRKFDSDYLDFGLLVKSNETDETISVTTVAKREKYNFIMPSSNVTVSMDAVYEEIRDFALLWRCDPALMINTTNASYYQYIPQYEGSSNPFSYEQVDATVETAFEFKINDKVANNSAIKIIGNRNDFLTVAKYYDTAVVSFNMNLITTSADKNITIGTPTKNKTIAVTEEMSNYRIPLKEITDSPDFENIRISLGNRINGDVIRVGVVNVWSRDTGKDDFDNYSTITDISGYEKSETNTLIDIIGDTDSNTPWNTTLPADPKTNIGWSIAWFAPFRGASPWCLTKSDKEDAILDGNYRLYFYPTKESHTEERDNIEDLTPYVDTGYVEFYVKCDESIAYIPISFRAYQGKSEEVSVTVKYDKTKARPDGYMLVRIPFTYLRDMGLNLKLIYNICVVGRQHLPDCFYVSKFWFYSNYAEIPDPVIEEEVNTERDIPLDLDETLINCRLDKENKILYVPGNTKRWEVLSALSLDSEVVAVFRGYDWDTEKYTTLMNEDDIINEDAILEIHRREFYVTDFSVVVMMN